MNTGLRLAFGCRARSGKSESVKYLIETYGGVELAFATPIYTILSVAQDLCDFPGEKDRYFLQTIGTWAREKDPEVWVKYTLKQIEILSLDTHIYISDLRHLNELKALKEHGFTTVYLSRDDALYDDSFGTGSRIHSSEMELAYQPHLFDYTIDNNKGLKELRQQIESIVSEPV